MGKIKVAIIGVGNCASSLIQGIHKYVELPEGEKVSGVMHTKIGDYRIEDIEVVAAFDVDENLYVVDFGNNRIQKFEPVRRELVSPFAD